MDKINVKVVPAEFEHVESIAKNMREADRQELWASGLVTPELALKSAIKASDKAWTGLINDEPVCMFGVSRGTIAARIGSPWLLGTDALEMYQVPFLRRCRGYVSEMTEGFDTLINYVDARNAKSIRWLRWLGFDLEEARPAGVFGMPFHKFSMRISHV